MRPGYPSKRLTEQEGRVVLRKMFTSIGYDIVEDFPFDEAGVKVTLDGWDPIHRVGYEYMTREAHDQDAFRGPEIGKLLNRMERGELYILIIDGDGNPDEEIIEFAARAFIRGLRDQDETKPG